MGSDSPDLFGSSDGKRKLIVLDSREDGNGRALFSLSALHLCAPHLRGATVHSIDASGVVVNVALDAFSWDTGIALRHFASQDAAVAFKSADLYLSVTLFHIDRAGFELAARLDVPALVAVQFPALVPEPVPAILPSRFAHDTRQLAQQILDVLECRQ